MKGFFLLYINMKKILLIILSILFLFSCSNETEKSNDNFLEIGPGLSFKLKDGEKQVDYTKEIIEEYETIINKYDSLQIPLSKYIESDDKQIYIGLLLNANILDYMDQLTADNTISYLSLQADTDEAKGAIYVFASKEKFVVGKIIVDEKYSMKYVFNAVVKDSLKAQEMFDKDFFDDRIKR